MKLFAAQYLMWNCAPFLVAVGSFATYVLVDPENNVLDSRFGQLLSPRWVFAILMMVRYGKQYPWLKVWTTWSMSLKLMMVKYRTAFVSLSLFNTLQGPFFLLPYGVVCIIQVITNFPIWDTSGWGPTTNITASIIILKITRVPFPLVG